MNKGVSLLVIGGGRRGLTGLGPPKYEAVVQGSPPSRGEGGSGAGVKVGAAQLRQG